MAVCLLDYVGLVYSAALRGCDVTTNNPEVVAWYTPTTRGTLPVVALNDRSQRGEPLIRLSDYEALQAECEKLRKDVETERAIQRAAEVLPPGLSIEIEIEKGASLVSLLGPGSRVSCDFQGGLAEQINDAIDAAIDAAIEI